MTSALFAFLKQKIDENGPLTVSQYMRYRLYSPEIGYYFNMQGVELFGPEGDFITAPEISPLFGEMIGKWVLEKWLHLGKIPFGLVEWGPGRGLLMADILRTLFVMPEIFTKMTIHLVETSPFLTMLQQQRLGSFLSCPLTWHKTNQTLPWEKPILGIGNEFLDAFPVDQWVATDQGWAIRRVNYHNQDLCWDIGPLTVLPAYITPKPGLGTIIEVSQEAYNFVQNLGKHLTKGYFLFIDYGSFLGELTETLQGLYRHKSVSVLETQMPFDLTAHVNFAMLNTAALGQGLRVRSQTTQAAFLQDLGILQRALALRKQPTQLPNLERQLYRLLNSTEMGSLFKVVEWTKD